MNIITRIGLGFLVFGFLLLVGLIFVVVRFLVGGSANPPLTSPTQEFISFFVYVARFWFVFVIVGAMLIAHGAYQRRRND